VYIDIYTSIYNLMILKVWGGFRSRGDAGTPAGSAWRLLPLLTALGGKGPEISTTEDAQSTIGAGSG